MIDKKQSEPPQGLLTCPLCSGSNKKQQKQMWYWIGFFSFIIFIIVAPSDNALVRADGALFFILFLFIVEIVLGE